MLDSIYHMTLKLFLNTVFEKMERFWHIYVMPLGMSLYSVTKMHGIKSLMIMKLYALFDFIRQYLKMSSAAYF